MKSRFYYILAAILCIIYGCSSAGGDLSDYSVELYVPSYATGFVILGAQGMESSILKINTPWQDAPDQNSEHSKMVFIRRNGEPVPHGFTGSVADEDVSKIVCMSSSHFAMISALGLSDCIAGVSGKKFLYNSKATSVAEVGYDEHPDYETIVSLSPDIVLLYGIYGESPLENKLDKLGIPYAYIAEYVENHPLGKAEWLVAVAEILGCRQLGESLFSEIPARYDAVKNKVETYGGCKPKVMLNTPYGDSWFMPGTGSYMVKFIEDARGEYLFSKNKSNRSVPVSIEEAVILASQADYWLNANAESLPSLCYRYPNFSDCQCVENGNIYNCDKRTNTAGGNDFWESGVLMPDVILNDIATILHPGFGTSLYFYRKIE